jgi:hypothetical protein
MGTENENSIIISSKAKTPHGEEIATRKTIVYETLVDPEVIKVAGENLKDKLFTRYLFLKPQPNEVNIISIEKFYEPFILISGRYSIDYYRKHVWTIKIENGISEVTFPFATFKASEVTDSSGKTSKVVVIEGEERLRIENKASLSLNQSGIDVSLKQLPSAPSEKNPEETLAEFCVKKVPPNLDLSILRTRIQKRPTDISWIANETFEVNERTVIYTPRFRVTFKHAKTGKQKTAEFDGVNGKLIHFGDPRGTQPSI